MIEQPMYSLPVRAMVRSFPEVERQLRTVGAGLERSRQHIANAPYAEVLSAWYTATPASTSTITTSRDFQTTLAAGLPVMFIQNDVEYYGMLTSVAAALLTIRGAPLSASYDISELRIGYPHGLVELFFYIPGVYAAGAADVLLSIAGQYRKWGGASARCVGFSARHATDDTTVNPKVNLKIGGNLVSTNDTNNGVQVQQAAWTDNPNVAIDTTYYVCDPDEDLEIRVTVAGGTGDAADLSVLAWFVYASRTVDDDLTKTE